MAHKIQIKRGNKADLPTLNDGEFGLCQDTNELFIGNDGNKKIFPTEALRTARFVIGTSTAGWTSADCDYLCDGTADQVEINNAITALPATGGEIVILDGTYNITAKIDVNKSSVSIRGNGNATILKRMYDSGFYKEGVITLTGISVCKIADLQVDGNKTSYTSNNNYGIFLNSSSNSNTITGNTCNNNSYGINFFGSSSNTITVNTCNNNNYGINLNSSSNSNTITVNTCNNNDSDGIYLSSSNNNTITGNTCIRGTGLSTDYTESQHTIQLKGTGNKYNLISNNNCMGKAPVVGGGTGNTLVNNKWDASDDIQDIRQQINTLDSEVDTHKTEKVHQYEEGTFTPILKFGGNSVGITYSRQLGKYTKIGRVVNIDIDIILTSKGTSTGIASIGGLPFVKPVSPPYEVFKCEYVGLTVPTDIIEVTCNSGGGTDLAFPRFTKSALAIVGGNDANFANATTFRISGTYTI